MACVLGDVPPRAAEPDSRVRSAQAQTPTFSAKVEAVRVDVLVTDGARVVRSLGLSDFEIFDNGVAQQVDLASFEELPLHVVLAFDTSGSVAGDRMGHLRDAGRAVLRGLGKEDRVSLVSFDRRLSLRAAPPGEWRRIESALDRIEPAGETALVDGCFAGLAVADGAAGRALLIVFSDGVDTASWLTEDQVLNAVKRSDAVVYSVSAGQSRNLRFLERFSEDTGGTVFEVESTKDLERTFLKIVEEFRQRYLLSYSPRGVEKGGWHRLDVRVKGRKLSIKARQGYQR
jgi:VWFA-related protein